MNEPKIRVFALIAIFLLADFKFFFNLRIISKPVLYAI